MHGHSVTLLACACIAALLLPACSENGPAGPAADTTAPGRVSDLRSAVGAATDSSLTLLWTAPGDDGNQGQASAYDLRWSLTDIIDDAAWAASTPVSTAPAPHVAGETESTVVSGLAAGQIYYFALETLDDAQNRSARSNVASDSTVAFSYSAVVSPDGTGDFLTIQDALDGTDDEAVIYITPGTYEEGLVIEARSVTLVGADPAECVVIHPLSPSGASRVLAIDRCGQVRISGLHFVQQRVDCGNGVTVSHSNVAFDSCVFDSCGLTAGSSDLLLTHCTFYASSDMICDMIPPALVDLIDTAALIEQCIVFAGANGGIECAGTAEASVECTDCWLNPDVGHNYIGCPDPTGSQGNISVNPLVVDAPGGDFHLRADSPCLSGSVVGCGRMGALGVQ